MSKMKKAVAIALVATMTMGSTLTAFAADTGSGGSTGKGENEGHVDKELINVVLPTVPEGDGSPFEYITDPERLIQETGGARYGDYTFPESTSDTGVYFRTGENTFGNTSETLKVINKSSCDMAITITATATAASDKDLKLATSDSVDADNPLYLGLQVGASTNAAQAISATAATATKTISGTPTNFETQYTDNGYEFVTKEEAEQWKALEFSLTGKVHNGTVAAGTTAPTVEVTWAFEKGTASADTGDEVTYNETAEPAIISVSDYIKTDPQNVVINFSLGKGSDGVNADGAQLYVNGSTTAVAATMASADMSAKTLTISSAAGFLKNATANISIRIVLTQGGSPVKDLNGTIVVKNDYDDEPEILSITDFTKADPQDVVVEFSLGRGTGAVDADGAELYVNGSTSAVAGTMASVDMSAKTVTINGTAGFLKNATGDVSIRIALTKGGSPVKDLSGTIKIK